MPEYRSQTEQQYANLGPAIIADELGKAVVLTMYEPVAFYVPGSRYRPDFLHLMEDGEVVLVEVKKNRKLKSYRDSRAKLRASAETFPFFTWAMSVDLELEIF